MMLNHLFVFLIVVEGLKVFLVQENREIAQVVFDEQITHAGIGIDVEPLIFLQLIRLELDHHADAFRGLGSTAAAKDERGGYKRITDQFFHIRFCGCLIMVFFGINL